MSRPASWVRWSAVPVLLALLAACAHSGGPPRIAAAPEASPAAAPEYSIEEFLGTTRILGASFSPDGCTILYSSDQTGVFNAFAVAAAGGQPVQLTRSTEDAIRAESYFPADERFLYTSDKGGNELTHLYVRERDGSVRDLTPGDGVKAEFLGWARDDRTFFVSTNERDPKFFDLYEYQTDGYARSLFFKNDAGYKYGDVSPDRTTLALSKSRTTNDSDAFLHVLKTGETRNITPYKGDALNRPARFTPDGLGLYLISDEGSEFAGLALYDLKTGARRPLVRPSWEVTEAEISKSGRYLAVSINNDARTELRLFEAASMRPVALPDLPRGAIRTVTFSRDEEHLAFHASDSLTPRDLYAMDLGGGAPRRLTRSLNPRIDPRNLAEVEVVRFPSYDGLEIPGLLYRPHGASSRHPVPAIVKVHGGPGGQAQIEYSGLTQYLVNHGYAVFDINNRGSSGYGKTFFALDDRRHGEADLGDVVACRTMLAESGWVDAKRIGILGGSYGGYMVLAALAFKPGTFAVGVDLFGVANWVRTLESIPPYWESFREALFAELGDPKTDAERLRRISPLFHATNIKTPLIVLQGANDPRVLKPESDDIVKAVRANGVPVEYVVFPDEGHGFQKKENELVGYRAILAFLDQHLKGAAAGG
jgi:dipeptidyl aminopeptidase/acylaminoacyl peptidase